MQKNGDEFKKELKELIIKESDKDISVDEISDDEPLFGDESKLMLDSLDTLQISLAVQRKYGKKVNDSKDAMRFFTNINALADYINSDK